MEASCRRLPFLAAVEHRPPALVHPFAVVERTQPVQCGPGRRIAEERALLGRGRGQEGLLARARAVRERLEQLALGAAEAGVRPRKLFEQSPKRLADCGQRGRPGRELLHHERGVRGECRPRPAGEFKLRAADGGCVLAQRTKLAGLHLAHAPPGVLTGQHQPGRRLLRQPLEDLHQQQHVEEVGLEPQHERLARRDRGDQAAVPRLEEPVMVAQEARPHGPQLLQPERRDRAVMEHLPPRQDLALHAGRAKRPDRGVPVREVEHRRRA